MNRTYELITKAGYHITAHNDCARNYLFFCTCNPWECDGIKTHKKNNSMSEVAIFRKKSAFRSAEPKYLTNCTERSRTNELMLKAIDKIPLLKARIVAIEISESIHEIATQKSPTKRGRL